MGKIKILQMPIRNNRGGIAKYILENWRFIDKDKFTFDFISFHNQIDFEEELRAEGCKIHYVSCLPSVNRELFYSEINAILAEGYDAIHLHTSRWTGTQLEEIAMEREVPNVIVHSHNINIAIPPEQAERYAFFSERHENIRRVFSSNWKRYATNLCACSDLAARWLFGDKLAETETYILKNAIDTDKFEYNLALRERYRRELGLENCFVIGHVGRFEEQKNHEFIIRTFTEISASLPSARLLLIGWVAAGVEKINNLAQRYGIANKVRFLGLRDDVSALMQAMDMFILPSLYEGLGIVLIEAQASGLKCLASTGTPPEAKVTPDMKFLPLNESLWKDDIINIARNGYERKSGASMVADAGYSLIESVKVIERLYRGELIKNI